MHLPEPAGTGASGGDGDPGPSGPEERVKAGVFEKREGV